MYVLKIARGRETDGRTVRQNGAHLCEVRLVAE